MCIRKGTNDESCLSCSTPGPTDALEANTDWYTEDVVTFTLTTKEELAGLATLVNSGAENVGEFFGYFTSESLSTLITYITVGHVTVSGVVQEGDPFAGNSRNITYLKNPTTEE